MQKTRNEFVTAVESVLLVESRASPPGGTGETPVPPLWPVQGTKKGGSFEPPEIRPYCGTART